MSAERVNHHKHFEIKFARIGADIYKVVGKLPLQFSRVVLKVGLLKQTSGRPMHLVSQFFLLT